MVKKWITNMASEMSITKKMLATLREGRVNQAKQASQVFVKEEKEADNFIEPQHCVRLTQLPSSVSQ